ncbi:hypothetical protein [Fulvimarina sp. MAC8]|uniref:hypothetical protein n=1 Tax=Fulvimarina sp. MAC8 TaxID=3162874 RepID=UPI0032EB7D7E
MPALLVFLGSYFPLSVILLAQDFRYDLIGRPFCLVFIELDPACVLPLKNVWFSGGIFVVCLACLSISLIALRSVRPDIAVTVKEVKYVPAELIGYTIPYVVSFISIDFSDTGKFVGFLIFLGWMFWITYRAGLLMLNPVFVAFGWRYYEIAYTYPGSSQTHHGKALSRDPISAGSHELARIQDVSIFRSVQR